MNQSQKVIITCYLLDVGVDGKAASAFIQALEEGVAAGEADANAMLEEFMRQPSISLPSGDLGKVALAMSRLAELHESEKRLDEICHELALLHTLTSSDQPHEFVARVAVRRVSDILAKTANAG
jgi:hypothetical protein